MSDSKACTEVYLILLETSCGMIGADNRSQKVFATTTDFAALHLTAIYQAAQKELKKLMHTHYSPSNPNGRPFGPGSKQYNSKTYSAQMNAWETNYNSKSQEFQNLENTWNTPIQALDTHEQTLGNDSQQAAQLAGIMVEPMKQVGMLLGQQL